MRGFRRMTNGPWIWAAVIALVGCSRTDKDAGKDGARATGGAASPVLQVDRANLPPLSSYIGPLDEGRVRIAAPKGWHVSPRSKRYLCQFTYSRSGHVRLPRIRVLVEPLDGPEWKEVDSRRPEDARRLAELVAKRLEGRSLTEPVLPMVIGPHACARYVDAAKFSFRLSSGAVRKESAQRQIVCLVFDGRLYQVELHVHPGRILDFRDPAYAVVAGMQFIEPESEDSEGAEENTEGESAEKDGS